MTLYTYWVLLVYAAAGVLSQDTAPIVKTLDGDVRGSYKVYERNNYWAFEGIPYAKPPVKTLRLKDPEKPEGWSSTLEATSFKSKCPQEDFQGKIVGDEDCLYLNVFNPVFKEGEKFPVMVFIHGGNFQKGSADLYGPEQFMSSESKVVLVTFNYRLGLLGFLSTGDEACPGNLGLKDQVLALKWVRNNIEKFGGDPNSITLFGQGTGAVSVFLHILSPQSKDLFHKAITQSGSPLCNWTMEMQPYTYAVETAERLRCSTKSTSAIVNCIREKSVTELLEAQKSNKTFGDYPLRTAPVVEKDGFLPDTPENLLNSGNFNMIPLVSGVNKDDGAILYPVIKSYEDAINRNPNYTLDQIIRLFLLSTTDIRRNIEFVSPAIKFHYFSGIDNTNATQVVQSFVNMTTDSMFVSCNYKTVQKYSEKVAKVYMYTFEYKGETSMLDIEEGKKINFDGVSHGDELLYLFDVKTSLLIPNVNTKIQGTLTYLWTTFATMGDLSTLNYRYAKWEPYTSKSTNYYKINLDPSNETSYRQKEVQLWVNYLPNITEIRVYDDDQANRKLQIGGFGIAMLTIAIIFMIVAAVLAFLLKRKSKGQYFNTKTEDK